MYVWTVWPLWVGKNSFMNCLISIQPSHTTHSCIGHSLQFHTFDFYKWFCTTLLDYLLGMNLKSSRIWFDYMLLCPVSIFSNLVCISLRPHLSSSGGSVGLFEHISILWSSLSLLEALHKPEKNKIYIYINITEKNVPVLSINRAFHMYDTSPPTHAHPQSHQDQTTVTCTSTRNENKILYLNIAEYPKLQWMSAYTEDHKLLDYLHV